jgi:hypothetical protein
LVANIPSWDLLIQQFNAEVDSRAAA